MGAHRWDAGRVGVRRSVRLLVGASLLAALTGCGLGAGEADDDPSSDIDGSWTLVDGRDAEGTFPLGDRPVTLQVNGEEAGGTSACNHYFASVARDGDAVRFTGVGGTEMGCEPDVMALEQRYTAALMLVRRADRGAGSLTLSGPDVVLDFALDPPVPTAALVGTTWVLESLVDGETASSTTGEAATLVLAEDGSLSGGTGCREFRGSYVLRGAEIVVTGLDASVGPDRCTARTRPQDDHVLGVLDTFRATVDRDSLVLTAPDGRGLQLRAQD